MNNERFLYIFTQKNKFFLISTFLLFLLLPCIVRASEHVVTLTIVSDPSEADVYINGNYMGKSPIRKMRIEMHFGNLKIVIKKQGYYDWEKSIVVSSDTYDLIETPYLVIIDSRYGRLQVNSDPLKVKLFLNGYHRGYTPFDSVNIRTGKYKLTLIEPDCFDYSQDITISSGEVTKLSIKLRYKYGSVDLSTIPIEIEAEVYLNGEKKGNTPLYLEKIPVGSHQIKIYKLGYQEWSQKITVNSRETTKVKIHLIPAYGFINIFSQPDNAKIFLNNDYFGLTPKTLNEIFPGKYKITLTRLGYKDWAKEITVISYETAFVSAELEPWYVTFKVVSEPPSARVYLDDKLIGSTPLSYGRITYGIHHLRVEMEGYRYWQKELVVTKPKDININNGNTIYLEKINFELPLAISFIIPALAILYYLFFLPAKRRKKEELLFSEKEKGKSVNELEQKEPEVIDELENN